MSDIPQPFDGARLKVKRAYEHIRDFDQAFQAYMESKPYTLREQSTHGHGTWGITLDKRIPDEVMLIVGDAIHNLRTALDHCVWELLFSIDGWEPPEKQKRKIGFPTSATGRTDYEAAIDGIKTPGEGTREFLKQFEAFRGGGGEIFVDLHDLDVTDKHHLIVPVFGEMYVRGLIRRDLKGLAPPFEETVTRFPEATYKIENRPRKDVVATRDSTAYFRVVVDRFLSTPIHRVVYEFDEDHQTTFSVFFAEVQPFPNEPILPTLQQLLYLVSGAVESFAGFVSARAG